MYNKTIDKREQRPGEPKAPTNSKQYTCERYRDGRGNSQEDSWRVAEKERDMINSETIKNLRELMRMKEEIEAEITAAQDQIKAEMTATNNYEWIGTDYKVTWNEVTTNRIDTTALKKALPDVAAQYTKATTSRRFCLA